MVRQVTDYRATGDFARFIALPSTPAVTEISALSQPEEFSKTYHRLMATPISFQRIGEVQEVDRDHARALVESPPGNDPILQRLDSVIENGASTRETRSARLRRRPTLPSRNHKEYDD